MNVTVGPQRNLSAEELMLFFFFNFIFKLYIIVLVLPNLEKTLESPLDCKEIKPVNPKENQS